MTLGRFALYDRTDQFNGDGRACRIRRICAVHTISDGKVAQFDRVLVCGKRERNGTIPVRKLCALKFAVLEQSYRNAGDPDAAGRLNRYRIFLFSGTCRNADRGQYEHDTDQQASDDLTHDLLRPPEMIFPAFGFGMQKWSNVHTYGRAACCHPFFRIIFYHDSFKKATNPLISFITIAYTTHRLFR